MKNILRFCIIRTILVLVWLLVCACMYFTYMTFQTHNEWYRLDKNYRLIGWPGFLVDDSSGQVLFDGVKSSDYIDRIGITEDFIIGRMAEKWFAVNRHSHQVYGPFDTEGKLQESIKFNLSNVKIYDSPPAEYHVEHFSLRKVLIVVTAIFIFLFIGPIRITRFVVSRLHLRQGDINNQMQKMDLN